MLPGVDATPGDRDEGTIRFGHEVSVGYFPQDATGLITKGLTAVEWLHQFEDVRFEGLQGASARKTLLLVGVMAAHALGEGSGVGVSFCGHRGWAQVRAAVREWSTATAKFRRRRFAS